MQRHILIGVLFVVTATACGDSGKNTASEPATEAPCSSRKDESSCYGSTDYACAWDYMHNVCVTSAQR